MSKKLSLPFLGGMNTDANVYTTTSAIYRYARNMSYETMDGDVYTLSSEDGNRLILDLDGKIIIGALKLDKYDIAIFSTDNTVSEIGIFNERSKDYTTLIKSSCLNFNTKYNIDAKYSIINGCERVLYFTDRYNPYRVINIDNLTQYINDVNDANTNDSWNCELFRYNYSYTVPTIELQSINESGGNLPVGTYMFAIRYLDGDLNPSNWLFVTNPVPITGEGLSAPYSQIDGGYAQFNVPYEGSEPTTSNSITFKLSNLDPNQSYVQFAAIHNTSGTGTYDKVVITPRVPINTNSITYTYTGENSLTEVGSIQDIIVDTESIDVVGTHIIHDNALWLGNIKGQTRDYSAYQRYASKIKATFITKDVEVTSQFNPGDPKCPYTYWDTMSLMGDEVYALGIIYIFSDGSQSPVFHIPGRPKDSNDDIIIPASIDTAHLGDGDHPKWKVDNTGYYQLDSYNYPDIRDCNGESIWGVDYDGNELINTPIRYHRAPSRRDIPIYDHAISTIKPIGLQFTNVEYPDSSIVGHKFVIAQRDATQETVHDMAVICRTASANDYYYFDYPGLSIPSSNVKRLAYWSPNLLYNKTTSTGYIKFIAALDVDRELSTDGPYQVVGLFNLNKTSNLYKYSYSLNSQSNIINSAINRVVEQSYIISPYTYLSEVNTALDKDFYNFQVTNPMGLIILKDTATIIEPGSAYTAIFTSYYKEVYTDIMNIRYRDLHNNVLISTSTTDTFDVFGGDVFITYMNIHGIYQTEYPLDVANNIFDNLYQATHIDSFYMSGIWIESKINTALRHDDTQNDCNSFYRGGSLHDYAASKILVPDDDQPDKYNVRPIPCKEYYAYNKDFSILNNIKARLPLQSTYDYCSDCQDHNPYQIRVSKQGYQEQRVNNFRVLLANEFLNLPANTGELTKLVTVRDRLYAITEDGVYFIPTKPQTINTSESTAYIGTAERFAIPPKLLGGNESTFAGSTQWMSFSSCEYGTVFVDEKRRKIFLLSNGDLNEISGNGLKYTLFDQLELNLNSQYLSHTSKEYPYNDSPTHKLGIGFLSTYDPIKKRLIIHKKDYRLLDGYEFSLKPKPGKVSIGEDGFILTTPGGHPVNVSLDDVTYFENKSFTLSFKLGLNVWESYHSYLPDYMFYGDSFFYSTIDDKAYIHADETNPQEFYNELYESIIEVIELPTPLYSSSGVAIPTLMHSAIFTSIQFNTTVTDTNDTHYPYETFSSVYFYNSYQISPKLPIVVKDPDKPFISVLSDDFIPAESRYREFKISRLRDFIVQSELNLHTSDWLYIKDDYPIDRVPNPQVYDVNKSLYDMARLRDRFLGIRLFYLPKEKGRKINITYVSATDITTIR